MSMTFAEAKLKAKTEGVKIRHQHFTSDEFFEYKNGMLVCEMGYNVSTWYKGEEWQDGPWYVCE